MSSNQIKMPEEMSLFFNKVVSGYDTHMKETIKSFDDFYKSISIPIAETNEEISILDLGCGTGLEIQYTLEKCPNALITGMDVSQGMLRELSRKYARHMDQIKLVNDSYLTARLGENMHNYIVSVMTMHHLLPDIKLGVYKKIREALKSGGIYIEGDYVVSTHKEKCCLEAYDKKTVDFNTSENGKYHIDIPFSIETQTKLLLDAGFCHIEVIWKDGEAAILVARI